MSRDTYHGWDTLGKWIFHNIFKATSSFYLLKMLICSLYSRLDGKHVVFGEIVEGYDVVEKIEKQGTKSGTPKAKVVIADCGELK